MALRGLFATMHAEEQKRPVYSERRKQVCPGRREERACGPGDTRSSGLAPPFLTASDPGPICDLNPDSLIVLLLLRDALLA